MARSFLTASVVGFLALANLPASPQPSTPAARTSTVFVTALEENGAPVVDLVADDFTIKEDGKSREVLKAELARAPVQVAIIVDDNGTGIFRAGLRELCAADPGPRRNDPQHRRRADTAVGRGSTTDADRLATAIVALTAQPGTPDGGQLLEGIFQAAKDQEKRDAERPVIVVVTVGGEEHSTLPAHHVLETASRGAAARCTVITVANNTLRVMRPIDKPSALLEENLHLSEVLGEGPEQTGGWREVIVAAPGITPGLQRIAAELKAQLHHGVRPAGEGQSNGAAGRVDKQARRAVARTEQSAGAPVASYFLSKTAFCSGVIRRRLSTFAVSKSCTFSSTSQV